MNGANYTANRCQESPLGGLRKLHGQQRELALSALYLVDDLANATCAHPEVEALGVRVGFDRHGARPSPSGLAHSVFEQQASYTRADPTRRHPQVLELAARAGEGVEGAGFAA